MAGILVRTCTICGKVDKFPHNRDDKPRIWNINHELRNSGDPILCDSCQVKGEAMRRVDEKNKQKEADERQQRENEHKLSHCYTCNNKSTFFHYIFDKRTKKVWDSWSNATDPINQLVFCNETCFNGYLDKEHSFNCEQCYSKIKFNQSYYPLKDNKNIKFCSQDCGVKYLLAKEQQRQEALNRETNRLQEQIDDLNNQRLSLIIETMTKGEDISIYEWETADWLNDTQKNICREYVKKCQEREELKRQRDAVKNQSSVKLDADDLTASISAKEENSHGDYDDDSSTIQQPSSNYSDNSNNNHSPSDNINKPQTNSDKNSEQKEHEFDSQLHKREVSSKEIIYRIFLISGSILFYGTIFSLIFFLVRFIKKKLRSQKEMS